MRAAVLDARLASLSHDGDGDRLLKKVEGKTVDAVLRVRAGVPGALTDAPKSSLEAFQRAVLTNPSKIPELAARLSPTDLASLSVAEWALAWGECVRVADQGCLGSLERSPHNSAYELADLARFLRGESASLDAITLDPTTRAATLLARSRSPSLSPAERDRLVADARRTDWIHDQVTDAIPAWTRATAR
jgi:hypothetical protein